MEKSAKKSSNKKPHYYGHRNRLRNRFIEKGLESFADYEVVEMLLTYTIPRRDTKPQAKKLIDQFGSIPELLDADIDSLQNKANLSESTCVLFKFVRALITRYLESDLMRKPVLDNINKMISYLKSFYRGRKKELFMVFYLTNNNQIIAHENFGEGTETEAFAFPRRIIEGAIKNSAVSVIISHNHPGGIAEPSLQDINITKEIKNALKTLDISLRDHIILSDDGYFSFSDNGLFEIESCD